MRVLISNNLQVDADVICASARHAKRILNESQISTLLVAQRIDGREQGLDVLRWAYGRGCLPARITIVDSGQESCASIGGFLKSKGYRAFDDRQFIKLI